LLFCIANQLITPINTNNNVITNVREIFRFL
jgi:hypothetical protein